MAEDLQLSLTGHVPEKESVVITGTSATPKADEPATALCPRGCGRLTPATRISSCSCCRRRLTAMGCRRAFAFGNRVSSVTDPDKTFRVGLLYGPSGCGKSSLVKAGLLPRLAAHVESVYVEASREDTEGQLLRGIRRCCPSLPEDWTCCHRLPRFGEGGAWPAIEGVTRPGSIRAVASRPTSRRPRRTRPGFATLRWSSESSACSWYGMTFGWRSPGS